jgi:hypothetical protein
VLTTNPPSGGDHDPTPLEAGHFYTDPPPLGEADVFADGYHQLATSRTRRWTLPFALSAWGALQSCTEVETSVIRPFLEQWYASPKSGESSQACDGPARKLPPC